MDGDNTNTKLQSAFDLIYSHVADPRQGLGTEIFHFVSSLTPMVNVDLLIKDEIGNTLLTWRSDRYYGPGWHLPGGVVRFKEDPTVRIPKVAFSELGCEVVFEDAPLTVRSQITEKRDVRGHFISLLYSCRIVTPLDPAKKAIGAEPENGQWCWHRRSPDNLLPVHESFRMFIDA